MKRLKIRHRAASRGLTLVELIIVITIIGVLTAAIAVGVIRQKSIADVKTSHIACGTIRNGVVTWKATHPGEDCPTVDQLKAEKILDKGFSLKDPWGNPFKVVCEADEVTCTTAGPDKKEGTDDDIQEPAPEAPAGK